MSVPVMNGEMSDLSGKNSEYDLNSGLARKRGRPKGAASASIAEIRQQAATEKKQLRDEHEQQLAALHETIADWEKRYTDDVTCLTMELDLLRKREACYQLALGSRLEEVAKHLYETLRSWGSAELEEAQVDKRKRGRPRKTLK